MTPIRPITNPHAPAITRHPTSPHCSAKTADPPVDRRSAADGSAGTADGSPAAAGQTGGELNAAIARAVVRVYREYTGRGPTRAHAFFRHEIVVIVLKDVLTVGEHNLVQRGREDTVATLRRGLEASMRDAIVGRVEALTGHTVTALTTDTDIAAGLATMVLVLDRPLLGAGAPHRPHVA